VNNGVVLWWRQVQDSR